MEENPSNSQQQDNHDNSQAKEYAKKLAMKEFVELMKVVNQKKRLIIATQKSIEKEVEWHKKYTKEYFDARQLVIHHEAQRLYSWSELADYLQETKQTNLCEGKVDTWLTVGSWMKNPRDLV
jgi:DNA repair exonuclease SbcCD nuclease subunit